MRILFICLMLSLSLTAKSEIFSDAKWIGPSSQDLPFYPDYLPVFKIECDFEISKESSGSIVYGLNDPRLINPNFNIYNLNNNPDTSGIRVELTGKGKVNIYRYGYHPDDTGTQPIATFDADLNSGINHIVLANNLGYLDVYINDKKIGYIGLNPIGNGGDYLAFPVLAEMATYIPDGRQATFSNIKVRNFREPSNVIYSIPGKFDKSIRFDLQQRSMPEVRTSIIIPENKKIGYAKIDCSARGIYDLYVNGKRVTDDYFYPGSTQYDKTHLYHTFDLTPFLHNGENEILARLGEGWWSGGATFVGENWNFYGDRQSFIAEINVEYDDRSKDKFSTDPTNWEYSVDGPVVEGSFFQGEIFDARRNNLWNRIWKPAVEISIDSTVSRSIGEWKGLEMVPSFGDRVIAVDTLGAVSMTEPRPGVYVYDMGQNMAAVPSVTFNNLKPGQEVTLRYAEVLYPDMPQYASNKGMIMTENLRAAMCRDIYKASGEQSETYSPRFTLHGYRYIEVTGIDEPLPLDDVKTVPVSSIHRFKAHYECSDTLVNRLWENIKWSSLSNFISLPTDCPQRNERLGWMGDISVFAPTATKIADLSALLKQYLRSVRDCQTPDGRFPDVAPTGFGFGGLLWGSAGITVPWEHFKLYGDISLLQEHYPAMKRYIDYILSETIEPETGIIVQNRAWGDLADWLSPEYDKTDKSLLWECYFIYDLEIMREVATLLGFEEDASKYDNLRHERIEFFKKTYIDHSSEKTIWSAFDKNKQGDVIDTQVSYALPIAFGIYDNKKFVSNFLNTVSRENIADDGTVCPPYSLMTGFIGTAWIMDALSKTGNPDMAYRLLTSVNYPSWLYPVTQGATTVWERLNSYTHKDGFGKNNSMNSFNHYSFGAVGNWMLTRSLGININMDGDIEILPEVDRSGNIKFAKGWLETPRGKVCSSWKVVNDEVVYEINLPEGTKGRLKIPGKVYDLHSGSNTIVSSAVLPK